MYVDELRRLYRSRFDDANSKKYALSDADFLMYINEAQDQACIRANLIFDKTSSFCTISVTAGTSIYNLDDSIYGIKYARLINSASESIFLELTTDEELDIDEPNWRDTESEEPYKLIRYHDKVELYPTPADDYTLKLEVYRLGEPMSSDKSEPEIRKQWHPQLVEWVLYRMYSMPDEDMNQPQKAAMCLSTFESVFGALPKAHDFIDRFSNHVHHNKTSLI